MSREDALTLALVPVVVPAIIGGAFVWWAASVAHENLSGIWQAIRSANEREEG